jgi:hypothetical protein
MGFLWPGFSETDLRTEGDRAADLCPKLASRIAEICNVVHSAGQTLAGISLGRKLILG